MYCVALCSIKHALAEEHVRDDGRALVDRLSVSLFNMSDVGVEAGSCLDCAHASSKMLTKASIPTVKTCKLRKWP